MNTPRKPGRASYILLIAFVIVLVVSFLPLGRLSGGLLHDFSLVDDIVTERFLLADTAAAGDAAPVDSVLMAMMLELESESAAPGNSQATSVVHQDNNSVKISDPSPDSFSADTTGGLSVPPPIDPRRDGYVAIEDYSADGALERLRSAFASSSYRHVRLGFVGDSYIEGDIFTQDMRSRLQERYGGRGVGYVNMFSEFPGFRRSVRQSGDGWNVSVAGHMGFSRRYAWLSEQYSTPKAGATAIARYAGVGKIPHADSWSRSTLALWAPDGGSLRMRANKGEWQSVTLDADEELQTVSLDSAVISSFEVSISSPRITALGVWLDTPTGVSVDCMSSRGFSGVTLRDISPSVASSLTAAGIGYDLIVLEFGINAMSPGQTRYASYATLMTRAVEHLQSCYPTSVILIMGIGDRGEKRGGTVRSMVGAAEMVAAQRDIARSTGSLFWDTREAMGGDGAVAAWANAAPPRVNKDYIHLNHHGGDVLAGEFVKSLIHALDND